MAFKKNVVKVDLRSYPPYLIMGEKKIGKSTLFRDLVLYNFKTEDAGLLLSFADEEGYRALDKLQYESVTEWDMDEDEEGNRGLVQIIDDLVDNKNKYGIEMICFDTLDKMVEVATQQVYEEHRKLKGSYPISLNDSLGGYGRGNQRCVELILNQIGRLRSVGYAVFIIAHTKRKDQTDMFSGETYEQVTNSLTSTFYNPIANTCQMIVNIVMDREIEKTNIQKKKSSFDKEHNKLLDETRMMYFVGTSIVDAGGRFTGLPEKLPLSAENFMKAFETGVKNSMLTGDTSDEAIENKKKEEEKEIETKVAKAKANEKAKKEPAEEYALKVELFETFQKKATKLTKEKVELVKKVNDAYGITPDIYKDVDKMPIEAIKEYIDIINM